MSLEVGFVGLGVMGHSMAGHILRGGHHLTVYNRTPSKTESLKKEGAAVASSLKELAEKSSFVFICAGDGASVREIVFGSDKSNSDSLVSGLKPGAIIVDHSTISPAEALDLANDIEKAGFRFLDAPITGGDIGARNGTLTTMVGGDAQDLEKVRPVLSLYSKKICLIGPNGFGQKMKAVNQVGAIGGVALLSELMHFATAQGLDPAMTVETLKDGGASSFALNVYGPKIVNGDFKPGFSVKHSKKDIGIVLNQAKGLDMPFTEVTFKALENAANKGLSEEGNHVLFTLKGEK